MSYTPTDTADYNTASSTARGTVNPKAQTVTGITASDKAYGGNTTPTPGRVTKSLPGRSAGVLAGLELPKSARFRPSQGLSRRGRQRSTDFVTRPAPTLNTSGVPLVGKVVGDVATLNSAGATGAFASPDVGTGKTVLVSRRKAVNAKTPRGEDAMGREMGRERRARINHPAGEAAQEPKSSRLGTFAPLR